MTDEGEIHRNALKARIDPAGSEAGKLMAGAMVRMSFERNVGITLADHSSVKFERGQNDEPVGRFICDVPQSLSDHPYLIKAGMKPAEDQGAQSTEEQLGPQS